MGCVQQNRREAQPLGLAQGAGLNDGPPAESMMREAFNDPYFDAHPLEDSGADQAGRYNSHEGQGQSPA